jgi:hypothetical protein
MKTPRIVGLFALGLVALGALGCEPNAYRIAESPGRTARAAPARRPVHCRDVPAEVACRPADTGR